MSAKQLEFYFEFSSPYGYLASELIEGFAEENGVQIVWKPFLMGAVFKAAGTQPLLHVPMKGDYSKRDLARAARFHNIPFQLPAAFPLMPVAASRAAYWAEDNAPQQHVALIHALYRYAFKDGEDFGSPEVVADIAAGVGIDRDRVAAALQDQSVKDRLRHEVETALERQVFGSPMFYFEGEPFWGIDHMDQLAHWIRTGGW